jgi:ketosteroid isomerase-like protein
MPGDDRSTDEVASRIRAALDSADLAAFADLLDPDVRWGAPEDDAPACRDRSQVLAWYQRGRERGVRASVTEVTVAGDKLLVGLQVVAPSSAGAAPLGGGGGPAGRWQVLTLAGGRVVDIRGFDDRDEAARRVGLPA